MGQGACPEPSGLQHSGHVISSPEVAVFGAWPAPGRHLDSTSGEESLEMLFEEARQLRVGIGGAERTARAGKGRDHLGKSRQVGVLDPRVVP